MATMKDNTEINVFPSPDSLFKFAAKDFNRRANAAILAKNEFSVVLSGGNTPKLFFDILAKNYIRSIPWDKIRFFFGDERYVAADNAASNFHMAHEHLFSKVPVNFNNIFRIPTEFTDSKDAAIQYARMLRQAFHFNDNSLPQFDLVYLGLGDDGHTASLMPLSKLVERYIKGTSPELCSALFIPKDKMYRITLTPATINNARNIIFLVTGMTKAIAVVKVLEGQTDPLHFPAQLIHSMEGKTIWYLDKAAATNLSIIKPTGV